MCRHSHRSLEVLAVLVFLVHLVFLLFLWDPTKKQVRLLDQLNHRHDFFNLKNYYWNPKTVLN